MSHIFSRELLQKCSKLSPGTYQVYGGYQFGKTTFVNELMKLGSMQGSDSINIQSTPKDSGKQPTTDRERTHRVADNRETRGEGSILQNGGSLYVVYEARIWNKSGERMVSLVGSDHYQKVGQMLGLDFRPSDWYDEELLELRR